nr:MAG TPA: hypothetical protein [Caudoviricetes sp.]
MYQITTATGEKYLAERVDFVHVLPSGNAYLVCDERKAEGVVFHGTPYLYKDGNVVTEVDKGADIAATEKTVSDNDAMNVDLAYRMTLLELGVSE